CRPIPGNNNPCGSNDSTNVPGWVPVDIEEPFGAAFFPNWEVSAENFLKIKHWLRNNIDTSGLDSCRRLILRKLIGKIGDSPIGLLLTNLDEAIGGPSTIDKFKVNFVTKPLTNKHGSTEYPTYDPVNHEFEVDIVLDSAIAKDATELYIANTLIHELVHAYMIYIWRKVNSGATATQLDSLSYTHAFNSYIDTLLKKDSLNPNLYLLSEPYHHNYMADQLLDFMASLLENFDSGGINNKKYYWYMAWSGLVRPQVKTWKRHWPNHPNWPPSNPSPSEDSTRGLKYALTLARIDSIYNTVLENESKSLSGALGRKPVSGGCY
ncbi:MAG: hypothetical protein JNK14_19125, partial [Chitinophagaceae bacterium]|nr:hypothetical protein [Chitinophagaceae bacterium]